MNSKVASSGCSPSLLSAAPGRESGGERVLRRRLMAVDGSLSLGGGVGRVRIKDPQQENEAAGIKGQEKMVVLRSDGEKKVEEEEGEDEPQSWIIHVEVAPYPEKSVIH